MKDQNIYEQPQENIIRAVETLTEIKDDLFQSLTADQSGGANAFVGKVAEALTYISVMDLMKNAENVGLISMYEISQQIARPGEFTLNLNGTPILVEITSRDSWKVEKLNGQGTVKNRLVERDLVLVTHDYKGNIYPIVFETTLLYKINQRKKPETEGAKLNVINHIMRNIFSQVDGAITVHNVQQLLVIAQNRYQDLSNSDFALNSLNYDIHLAIMAFSNEELIKIAGTMATQLFGSEYGELVQKNATLDTNS